MRSINLPLKSSRQEHDIITGSELVRKHIQAKQFSEASSTARPPQRRGMSWNQVVDVARRSSLDCGPWNDYYYHSSRMSPPAGLASVPGGSPNSRSRPRPPRPGARRQQQQQQKQYPNNQHRYTVSDRRQDMPGPVVCAPVRSGEGSAGTMVQLHKRKLTNYFTLFSASHSSTRSGRQ